MADPRFLIIADGNFHPLESKTANSVIRYHPSRVVGVLDRQKAGQTAQDVLGFGGAIPIVGSIEAGLALRPNAIMIGIAPAGGRLPDEWNGWLAKGLEAGCDLISGLHTFLSDDPSLAALAVKHGRTITDARKPPNDLPIAAGLARLVDPFVVLTVGTDCNSGKMTSQLQLTAALKAKGLRTNFVATGQTGIFIEGWGTAVDAVVADFIAGAAEELVLRGARDADIVLVEGQGSINHPGYSGVTLGLLHGACPDALLLCHQATREFIGEYRVEPWLRIPPLSKYVQLYELIGSAVHPTRVIGIALNTYDLDETQAKAACLAAAAETGLPCTDPVRFAPDPLVNAVVRARDGYLERRRG
ncbi:MAG: DUF1611 domain-containing protein [Gemmatimonadetes bacterium]|nr:DUF1611 domain-containing protein [Gemmatimonadota bacterium]